MNPEEARRAEDLVSELRRRKGAPCTGCRDPLQDLDVLSSLALGFKEAPRCASCLADALDRPLKDLKAHLEEYFQTRPCYREARSTIGPVETVPAPTPPPAAPPAAEAREHSAWAAGCLGCGDLVLELRSRMAALPAGAVLKITATDPGAPEDLPAWCRMTGHLLVKAAPPEYWIRKP